MVEFEIVKAKPEASVWIEMLSQVEPGMAARFETDDALLKKIRAYIWRYRGKYEDFYTYSDDEYFYIARKAEKEE